MDDPAPPKGPHGATTQDLDQAFRSQPRPSRAEAGPDLLALEIDKRITAVSVARTRVSWRKRGELIDDLNTHRDMIVERLAPEAPGEALAVLIRWFDLYPGLAARVKDTKGELPARISSLSPRPSTIMRCAT